MIKIAADAWQVIVSHAESAYPQECCGILLGSEDGGLRTVSTAIRCRNAYEGDQSDRFLIDPAEQLAAERRARASNLEVLGFFHSHPDCDAYFSTTDLKNSWPWYSNLVVSVKQGTFSAAAAFRANEDQTGSEQEELILPGEAQG